MTDKELKRLNRMELLEMLLEQAEKNRELEQRIAQMQEQLDDRRILLEEAGSIAEAAMRLSGVFEAAETAAARYLENIKRISEEREAHSRSGTEERERTEIGGGSRAERREEEIDFRQVMEEFGAH